MSNEPENNNDLSVLLFKDSYQVSQMTGVQWISVVDLYHRY